jgi:beta-galactosidase
VNGKSLGVKKRNSQDFPAAGLRWSAAFVKGNNTVSVVAKKGNTKVEDNISFQYQTEKWGKPAQLKIEKLSEENGIATVQVKLYDDKNVQCLDAVNFVRFGLAGDGELIDDLGTSTGSRYVQMYNGRAIIRIKTNKGKNAVSAKVEGLPTALIQL